MGLCFAFVVSKESKIKSDDVLCVKKEEKFTGLIISSTISTFGIFQLRQAFM